MHIKSLAGTWKIREESQEYGQRSVSDHLCVRLCPRTREPGSRNPSFYIFTPCLRSAVSSWNVPAKRIGLHLRGLLPNLLKNGKEGPELRQVQISATHIRADHYRRHLEILDGPFCFLSRRFGILQGQRSRPLERMSSMAICSATRTGSCQGSTMTAVPN